jgi:ubiquinone/menaquinone biosynthesis C-methylase UbiE
MHDEVEEFYDSNPQREWDRLCGDYYHSLEFWTTLHLFRKFLPPPPARILDCGGGPGRYSIAFTKLGYRVTLLDLSRNLLETARHRADKAGIVLEDYLQASATEIPAANDFYDGVLLAGPLYHLIANEDRAKAMQESLRVLKSGGVVAAAIIPLLGVFRSAIAEFPDFIESGEALR